MTLLVSALLAACTQAAPAPSQTQALMERLDRDRSGGLAADELTGRDPASAHALMDRDRDGEVSVTELEQALTLPASLGGPPPPRHKARGKRPPQRP